MDKIGLKSNACWRKNLSSQKKRRLLAYLFFRPCPSALGIKNAGCED
jgi:hypothetical protein